MQYCIKTVVFSDQATGYNVPPQSESKEKNIASHIDLQVASPTYIIYIYRRLEGMLL